MTSYQWACCCGGPLGRLFLVASRASDKCPVLLYFDEGSFSYELVTTTVPYAFGTYALSVTSEFGSGWWPALTFVRDSDRVLVYATRGITDWGFLYVSTGDGLQYIAPSLDVNESNQAAISSGSSGGYRCWYDSGGWTSAAIGTNVGGVRRKGNHIWFTGARGGSGSWQVFIEELGGATALTPAYANGVSRQGFCLDADGRPLATPVVQSPANGLWYAEAVYLNADGSLTISHIASGITSADVAIDSTNRAWVVYAISGVPYISSANVGAWSWSEGIQVSSVTCYGRPAIAITEYGAPAISYIDGGGRVRLYILSGETWQEFVSAYPQSFVAGTLSMAGPRVFE